MRGEKGYRVLSGCLFDLYRNVAVINTYRWM